MLEKIKIQANGLPEGFEMRPATMDDLHESVELMNLATQALIGVERKFDDELIGADWQSPGFELERDTRLVISPQNAVVGYIELWDINDKHVRMSGWGKTHPEYMEMGIGSSLVSWAEGRARSSIALAPAEARIALQFWILNKDAAAHRLLEKSGFQLIRHNLRMVIDLNGEPEPPRLPDGITIRTWSLDEDIRPVVQTVRACFKDHWGYVEGNFEDEVERWLHYTHEEDFDASLWFLAMDGNQIVGTSLCRSKALEDEGMGWVGTLGVRRSWRKRGIGEALLRHSFLEFHRRGKARVGLGVDAQSLTGATRLYLKAGMHPDPDYQYDTFEKELRPGIDLSTQTVSD